MVRMSPKKGELEGRTTDEWREEEEENATQLTRLTPSGRPLSSAKARETNPSFMNINPCRPMNLSCTGQAILPEGNAGPS